MSQGTFMTIDQQPLNVRVYSLLSIHDVELAESFIRHCPSCPTVEQMNQHLRMIIGTHSYDHLGLVDHLTETQDIQLWCTQFMQYVCPFLIAQRLSDPY